MANLLIETLADIDSSGHTPDDIVFIGSPDSGHQCTWAEFECLANREYDDGYGAQKVATDLIIAFSDGTTMWRHEYDGAEFWQYSAPFTVPAEKLPIRSLFVAPAQVGWESLKEIDAAMKGGRP